MCGALRAEGEMIRRGIWKCGEVGESIADELDKIRTRRLCNNQADVVTGPKNVPWYLLVDIDICSWQTCYGTLYYLQRPDEGYRNGLQCGTYTMQTTEQEVETNIDCQVPFNYA